MSDKYPGGLVTAAAPAGYSVFFDGSGDFLSRAFTSTTDGMYPQGTTYTIEAWVYMTSTSGAQVVYSCSASNVGAFGSVALSTSSGVPVFECRPTTGGTNAFVTGGTVTANTWTHIAGVVSAGTARLYVNGVSVGTPTSFSAASFTPVGAAIGRFPNGYVTGITDFTGYISNLRITQSTAVYTAAFTPPTQLLNIANTSLLTCQSPTIIDNSSNNFTITTNGNAAVSTFTPFPSSYYFYNAPTNGNTRNMVPANVAGFNPAYGAAAPGVWTLDQAQYFTANRLWPIYDPYFNLTTLMLPGNGTNGAQNNTFLDSSTNNFTITRNGNTTQGTFSPFSQTGWGVFTSDRNYLTIPASSDFDLISTNFTVEFFVNVSAFNTMASSGSNFFGNGLATALNGWSMGFAGSGSTVTSIEFRTFSSGSQAANSFTVSFPLNTWVHVALVRNGSGSNNFVMYVNGVQQGSAQTAVTYSSAGSTFVLGSGSYLQNATYSGNAAYFISNVRVSKTVVYSANFTPPTSALPALASTTLLICASNRFINLGTNTGAITATGWNTTIPSIQPFSPFAPAIPYSAATVGGSGYFDGTGDWLSNASLSPSLSLGSSNFCIEAWGYWTSFNEGLYGAPLISFGGGGGQFMIRANKTSGSSTSANYYFVNNGTFIPSAGYSSGVSGGTIFLNSWNHIAVTRQGSTFRLFVNGALVNTQTDATSYSTAYTNVIIGADTDPNNGRMLGYVAGARMVTGNAVYTAAFTPPIAPPTPISGTYLLANFTNAGIIDATSKNVLETVGNAQISTTQSKFGGSSIAFDGTGDRVVMPATELLNLASGDFTVEVWIYTNTITGNAGAAYRGVAGNITVGTEVQWSIYRTGSTLFVRPYSGTTDYKINVGTIAANTWYHVALVRSGDTFTGYLNGTSGGTQTISGSLNNNVVWFGTILGYLTEGGTDIAWNGYLDDLRVTKGFARYTANFVPPTSALQLQ